VTISFPPPSDGAQAESGSVAPSPELVRVRDLLPDNVSVEVVEKAIELDRLLTAEYQRGGSEQLRVADPEKFATYVGGAAVWSFIDWLGQREDECPSWGTHARDVWLDDLWRSEPRLAGVMFTMVSRIAVTGWTISGPVDLLKELWPLFGEAEQSHSWSDLIRPVCQNYLGTDIGGIIQTVRNGDGLVTKLYYLPSKRCLAGPLKLKGDVWDLLFQDVDGQWKGYRAGEFARLCSMPDTDPLMRRIGFCFMSRCQRAARNAIRLLEYKEEKLSNLPPEGIAAITGLTKTQVENAIALYRQERQQLGSLTFPGVLWLVANVFGQEVKVDFISFRDVWAGFDERTEAEIYMKTVSLDAGVDVGEFWQVEFHGATRAAAERQHRKALGKGPAEFMVDFERVATSWLPFGCVFQFDVVDDEQDLMVERVREARIKNILTLWRPDPVAMQGLLTIEQAQELLAQERVVPQRFFMPKESVVTDIIRELTGSDVGTIDQDGVITRRRQYWELNGRSVKTQFKFDEIGCDDCGVADRCPFYKAGAACSIGNLTVVKKKTASLPRPR